ncbi:diguanylate cyclase [Cellulosilyticum sp. I15G10I2]|uniref:diguanylate cyclase n=1 Tax=Cellulosilyticum sp. I15G10I2 TaxID=1892843 RepID=UPI00085C4E4F|nr:diguanylate cyclase [Cellulosilyticum sp. I15G10I2]
MRNNKEEKYLFKIFSICSVVTLLIIVLGTLLVYQMNDHKNTLVEVFANEQQMEVTRLAEEAEQLLADAVAEDKNTFKIAETKVIDEIIKTQVNSHNQYIFFYDREGVLFEKDASTTQKYQDKSINALFDKWRYEGGQDLEAAEQLMNQGISGTATVIKQSDKGKEVLAWTFLNAGEAQYIIGIATLETYMLTTLRIPQHFTRIYMLGTFIALGIVVLSILFSIYIFDAAKKANGFKNEIKNKNLQIEKFSTQINAMQQVTQTASIYDLASGVYNREFFDNLMTKLNIETFLPLTFIRISLTSSSDTDESVLSEEILKDVAKLVGEKSRKSDIVARLNQNELVLVMLQADKELAQKFIDDVKEAFNLRDNREACIKLSMATQNQEDESIWETLEKTINKTYQEETYKEMGQFSGYSA